MIHLSPDHIKIKTAKKRFFEGMKPEIEKRIKKVKSQTLPKEIKKKFKNKRVFLEVLKNHIEPKIEEILIAAPDQLYIISNTINSMLKGSHISIIKYIFDYEAFIRKISTIYDAYDLAQDLNINTCTYCNRNYTNTVISENGNKITRPTFDHYFTQENHPLLAVSFYNLIPSCSICNSGIKGRIKLDLNNNLHPYIDDEMDKIWFNYKFDLKANSGIKVVVKGQTEKSKNFITDFCLEEIYSSHSDIVLDLLIIKQAFSPRYIDMVASNVIKGVHLTKEEVYRILFGTEYEKDLLGNKPMSKFKKDILEELGIIERKT